tara:strand:+ start:3119 stop:3244 length:126 start_codon:yes stop_codon:yes gene_type:complete
MSEQQEATIRNQAVLMLMRSLGKKTETKRILNKFLKCIKLG